MAGAGVDALWRREMSADSLSDRRPANARSLDAEFGYGIPVRGGTATGTPWAGLSVSEQQRGLRAGFRIRLSSSVVAGVVGAHQRGAADGDFSSNAIMFKLVIR